MRMLQKANNFFWQKIAGNGGVIEHQKFDIDHGIANKQFFDRKLSSVDLDSLVMSTECNQKEVAASLSFLEDNVQFVNEVLNRATSDYIFTRLFGTRYSVYQIIFSGGMQFPFHDRYGYRGGDNFQQLICAKSADLSPLEVLQHHQESVAVLPALEEEKRVLLDGSSKVDEPNIQTCIPIVLGDSVPNAFDTFNTLNTATKVTSITARLDSPSEDASFEDDYFKAAFVERIGPTSPDAADMSTSQPDMLPSCQRCFYGASKAPLFSFREALSQFNASSTTTYDADDADDGAYAEAEVQLVPLPSGSSSKNRSWRDYEYHSPDVSPTLRPNRHYFFSSLLDNGGNNSGGSSEKSPSAKFLAPRLVPLPV